MSLLSICSLVRVLVMWGTSRATGHSLRQLLSKPNLTWDSHCFIEKGKHTNEARNMGILEILWHLKNKELK